jgi:hypothetical protein
LTHIELTGNHGLQHLLGINEANSNPDQVDLSSGIIPVIDMSMTGHLRLNQPMRRAFCVRNNTLNSTVISFPVLEYGNITVPGVGTIAYSVGNNFRVISCACHVIVRNDAWRVANNGRTFMMELLLTVNGSEYCAITRGNIQINSNNPWSFLGSANGSYYGDVDARNLIVPAGATLSLGIICNGFGGVAFNMGNANNVELYCELVGIETPVGAPVPSFW